MGYVITGIVSFVLGSFAGVVIMCLCMTVDNAEYEQTNNPCDGCFGASFGDCDRCPKNEERGER